MIPKLKICGFMKEEDAASIRINDVKLDYAGVILAPSRRRVSVDLASAIFNQLPRDVGRVGVFVDADPKFILQVSKQLRLNVVQLHGRESLRYCQQIKQLLGMQVMLWKAMRIDDDIDIKLATIKKYTSLVDGILLDTYSPREQGGTGKTFNWELIPIIKKEIGNFPLIVAGGINEENVLDLLKNVQPYGIDVSSGVETNGSKDKMKMKTLSSRVKEVES